MSLLRGPARFILKLLGWKLLDLPQRPAKAVVIAYPHTSNWDFPLTLLALAALLLRRAVGGQGHHVSRRLRSASALHGRRRGESARTHRLRRAPGRRVSPARAFPPDHGHRRHARPSRPAGSPASTGWRWPPMCRSFLPWSTTRKREVGLLSSITLSGDRRRRHGAHRHLLRRPRGLPPQECITDPITMKKQQTISHREHREHRGSKTHQLCTARILNIGDQAGSLGLDARFFSVPSVPSVVKVFNQ